MTRNRSSLSYRPHPGFRHQTLEQEQRMSTKASRLPGVPSMQFQSQMIPSQSEPGPGDHLFKAALLAPLAGFEQTKSADVANVFDPCVLIWAS